MHKTLKHIMIYNSYLNSATYVWFFINVDVSQITFHYIAQKSTLIDKKSNNFFIRSHKLLWFISEWIDFFKSDGYDTSRDIKCINILL